MPSILSIYTKQGSIIAISNLDGSKFINTGYKSNYFSLENKYYYYVEQYTVQEIGKKKFSEIKGTYTLVWSMK